MNNRRWAGASVIGIVGCLAVFGVLSWSGPGASTPSPPRSSTVSTAAARTVLYLDLGASVSVGVQPTAAVPHGQPTNRGYANRLVTFESTRGITMNLTQLGCPGESIATMLHGPDSCYLAPDTQLSDAVVYLRAHVHAVTLVTVDLGFNTLDTCFHHLDIDLTCVNPQLALLRQQLSQVVRTLTRAAGPHVTFVGIGHYNPYLTQAAKEGASEVFAGNSVVAIARMNATFKQVYGSFSIKLANVARAFHENSVVLIDEPGKEAKPDNVHFECSYTWMCSPRPYGPNIHPKDAGYQAITDAIVATLPPTLK